MTIRPAEVEDLSAINDIYNYYVLTSTATYQTEPTTPSERLAWFKAHDSRHPVLVALDGTEVIGWGSLSLFHPRAAFALSVEDSVYLRKDQLRKGIGRAMLAELIQQGQALGHRTIVGVISADQTASIRLHAAMGFEEAGLLKQVGKKFGRWLDVAYMQLML